MDWVFFEKTQGFLSPSQQPFFLPHTPPPPPPPSVQSVNTFNKVSPSILLIIIIIAIIFFISGLLHLLVRFLFRPSYRDPEDSDNVTALQGQLQQLFNLHDSGVDQTYIDTLPVFQYKAIIGLKNPFDCAVCLCEFEDDDKLRLLPLCSHAFHLECIDTWLLSHSTCPLCRSSLLPEFPYHTTNCSPLVLVLESGDENSREMALDRDVAIAISTDEFGSSCNDLCKNSDKGDVESLRVSTVVEEKIIPVKLGKFRNVDNPDTAEDPHGSSTSNVDSRRCFSMGSFEYVLDESSSLQISVKPHTRKQTSKKPTIPLTPRHRAARSECDCHSSREGFKEFDTLRSIEIHSNESNGNFIGRNRKDSFSFSKTWLRTKKEKTLSVGDLSIRASSSRFPLQKTESADDFKTKSNGTTSSRTLSDINVSRWESSASETGMDEEVGSQRSLDSQPNMPSFGRRTLLWLVGKQNKVVHSSFPNV